MVVVTHDCLVSLMWENVASIIDNNQGRHQVQKCGVDTHGERAEREPITGSGGRAPSGLQGHSPWSGGQEGDKAWQKWGGHVHPSSHRGDTPDNNRFTVGVFIDLSKAFDTIDHKILLEKLAAYGIRGIAYDRICSYLNCRKQYVQTASSKSDLATIFCGVPQRSVHGQLLFLSYINDLVKVFDLINVMMFADNVIYSS